ncbi:unnamed protein product [Pieris brassicae]|uniref:Uncharacterized protein n=1 Tax=Pieris brassicae TaxID=7116 RepID=A0A9P0SP13_PIEBR|nr:unnamed protein product [Pieris brassicae]
MSTPNIPILAEALRRVPSKRGVATKGVFLAENAHTCVFLGLNWTRFSLPQSETPRKRVSTSDTSLFRHSSTTAREIPARPV